MTSSTYGGTVETASRPISTQGSLQLNVARRIASAASDQENENRRMCVRAVARAVRKCSSATVGTSGALELVEAEELPAEEVRLRRSSGRLSSAATPR